MAKTMKSPLIIDPEDEKWLLFNDNPKFRVPENRTRNLESQVKSDCIYPTISYDIFCCYVLFSGYYLRFIGD